MNLNSIYAMASYNLTELLICTTKAVGILQKMAHQNKEVKMCHLKFATHM